MDTLISSTLFTQFISNVCERGNKCFGDHNAIFATPPQFDVMFKTRAVSVLNSFKNDPLLVVFAFSFNC